MTDKEIAQAVKEAMKEFENLSDEEHFRQMFEAGIIDSQGQVFSESLGMVEDLLKTKGFTGVSAFHVGHVPGGAVRLHEKVRNPREAVGPYEKIGKIISNAADQERLWEALEASGYCQKPPKPGKKKTG